MREFVKTSANGMAGAIFATTLMVAAGALASSHADKRGLKAPKTDIDMIITGANSGSLKRQNLVPGSIDKGDCPLCYHRELLKNNKNSVPKDILQPYPGE